MSSFRPAPYTPAKARGGPRDAVHRRMTFHFAMVLGPYRPRLYARGVHSDDSRPVVSERLGIVYPDYRTTVDGIGRRVAKELAVDAPRRRNDVWPFR